MKQVAGLAKLAGTWTIQFGRWRTPEHPFGSGARGRRSLLRIVRADGLQQPTPGFRLFGARGLLDRNGEIGDLRLDLLTLQEVQATHQNRSFDHRGLGAVEARKRRVRPAMHDRAMEARPLLMLRDIDHRELRV